MSSLSGNSALTSKEWVIASLVAQGQTNAQIAAGIQVTEFTVENQLRNIVAKTGCWNRTEVALWYLKMGVEKERRLNDRREEEWGGRDERRKANRRHLPERSPRANEQHEINLDE